ncbi:potassium-dependent mechanosensitive channel [Azospirillaceae bacterium]
MRSYKMIPYFYRLRLYFVLFVLLFFSFSSVAADKIEKSDKDDVFATQVVAWQNVLDKSGSAMIRRNLTEADFDQLRATLAQVFDQARAGSSQAAEVVASTRQMIEALGKPPGEKDPPEAEAVAIERNRLNDVLVRFDGQMRQADLVAARAGILLRTANERRLNQLAETLFRRGVSPLASETWRELPTDIQFLRERVIRAVAIVQAADPFWWAGRSDIGVAALVVVLLAGGVGYGVRRRFGQRRSLVAPSYRRRAMAAAAETFVFCLFPCLLTTAALFAALETMRDLQLVSVLRTLIRAAAGGVVAFFLLTGLSWAVLAPRRPAWRLVTIDDVAARPLAWRFTLLAAALALSGAALGFLEDALVSPELHAVVSFFAKLLAALALTLASLPGRVWRRSLCAEGGVGGAVELSGRSGVGVSEEVQADVPTVSVAPRVRLLAILAATAIVALSWLHYHNLGVYLAEMALAVIGVGGFLFLLRGVGYELVELFLSHSTGRLGRLRHTLFPTEQDLRVFQYFIAIVIDTTLLVVGFGLLLPLSGIAWSEVRAWGAIFLRGVTIGEVRISPADIFTAMLFVVGIMAVTRLIQRKFDERILERLQIDRGVRHSIRTGIGYFGALIAILTGIATIGLNLSNLALIAGALSVGIGFGLQAVVSNFVAGLILLVERPIKVGDWVVIGDKEGVVRRISVRATELQTFQYASVIIPNSELISRAVVNWTHKDRFGRIDIPVGVAYDSDLDLVQRLLMGCALADSRVLQTPAPKVVFRNFGASSLDLELRCFLSDIEVYMAVSTDLRFAIIAAFRAHGVEMPFAQTVIHSPQLQAFAQSRNGAATQ